MKKRVVVALGQSTWYDITRTERGSKEDCESYR